MGFSDIFNSVISYFTSGSQAQQTQASLALFKDYLNSDENTTVRMWVPDSVNYGHQSNTVNLINQLTNPASINGLEYAGTIEVYYAGGQGTLDKLFDQMPTLDKQATGGKVNDATVNLIAFAQTPGKPVNLAFTGGNDTNDNLAQKLNSTYFLELQPYKWESSTDQLQFSDGATPSIVLSQQKLLNYATFIQRGYWLPLGQEPDWQYYTDNGYANQVAILQTLLDNVAAGTYDLGVIYGVKNKDSQFAPPPEERLFDSVTGYLASQLKGSTSQGGIRQGAKPIVVLLMNDFTNKTGGTDPTLEQLINGGMTGAESGWNEIVATQPVTYSQADINSFIQYLKPHTYRANYLTAVDAFSRVQYLWSPSASQVNTAYSWLGGSNNRLLFIQLGMVPPQIFNYVMESATLPAVFEGQNTGNLAMQTGNPYFHVTSKNVSVVQYPTTLLGYTLQDSRYSYGPYLFIPFSYVDSVVAKMQQVANAVNFPVRFWPNNAADNPAEVLGSFIRNYNTADGAAYRTYYTNVQQFYQDVTNDKFRIALSYTGYVLQSKGLLSSSGASARALTAAAASDPLNDLLANIYANLSSDNILDLFPGVFSAGPIFDFISGLLGVKVQLTDATVDPAKNAPDPTTIVVAGNCSALNNTPLHFEITFTAPQGSVLSEWKMTYTGTWLTEQLPWLLFEEPYVLFTVADTLVPVQGGIGGTLQGLNLDLSIRLPIEGGLWQLEGHFEKPASVSAFYQLAGGVNLVQSLPSPFNAFAAIGVTDLQLAYNSSTNTIDYISFVMATDEPVTLMQSPLLVMDSITFNVLIQNPGSISGRKVVWSVTGKFEMGTGPEAGVIMTGMQYPDKTISGELVSGVIRVTDLFNMFLPGTVFDPQGYSPEVTEFFVSFDGTTGNYNVVANLNFDWTFQIFAGAPSVTINAVGVRVKSEDEKLQGGISGGFTFGEGDTAFAISLEASYGTDDGWVFSGTQNEDNTLQLTKLANQLLPSDWKIPAEYDYALKNLSFTFQETKKYFEIGGETDGYWAIPFIALKVRADLKFGYGTYGSGAAASTVALRSMQGRSRLLTAAEEDKAGYYCSLNADINWIGIQMNIFYDYNPDAQTFRFTWGVLTGTVTKGLDKTKPDNWIGTLKFTDSVSLGSIVEEAISWATGYRYSLASPWDLLNSLPLNALELVYDFTEQTVSFKLNIGEINLGFCKITAIGLNYQSGKANKDENGVFITIDGVFFWQSGDQISWDATKPETTPAPSGQGNKYFDLRLLALGQHVTIPGFANVTSVQAAIDEMAKLPDTEPGEIPGITFDANSSWLVGMDFGVLKLQDDKSGDPKTNALVLAADSGDSSDYFIDMQIVFNDPNLYALRIALSGEPARIFKGLDFQIMYRKISDSVGVYQAEIALPDVMRKIQLGQVNITLPVFGIEIYTNGDFLVDLGFPKNADFSRSFTLQMIIYVPFPIPIMGSAGLYFGKKSSATSTEVPVIDNGTFNPVLVFGVGIQFGLGYDFNAGILAAGFSLTFVTIIEGVLAKFNPYQAINTSTGEQADIAPAYYYSVKGVVGIQGKLYGYVDFKIIKAEVNVQISVLADITIAAYQPILLGITATVSVSVSIKINLGLFSIKISFSFNLTIRESYSIKAGGGSSPWNVVPSKSGASNTMLRVAGAAMPSYRALSLMAVDADPFNETPTWSNLQAPASKAALTGYIGLGLSMAGDMAIQPSEQLAVYSAMLFIQSVASVSEDPGSGALKAQGAVADTSFELLSKQVFRWVIAAFHNGSISAADVDHLVISKVRLQEIYDYLNNPDNTDPVPVADIDSFLNTQVSLTVSHPSDDAGEADTTYFPIAPKMSMSLPAFGTQAALNYTFENYNTLSETYIEDLRIYFDELAVQMQQDSGSGMKAAAQVHNNAESMATFIYADYFLLLGRQMIQNAQSALDVFQYLIVDGQTVADIVQFVNDNGQFETAPYSVNDLFESNKSHVLTTGSGIKVEQAVYTTVSDDTFDIVAAKSAYNQSFTATQLATLNKDVTTILQSGAKVTYPGKNDVTVQAGNTLTDIASAFGVTFDDLLSTSNVMTLAGLLLPSAKLSLPAIDALTQDADTLVSFSSRYGVSIDTLAQTAENAAIANLFDLNDNDGAIVFTDLPQFTVGQLISEIQADGGLQQLSGMASRYYLSGLRLPTAQITANYQGMWLDSKLQFTQDTAGLFSLTGQQFPIPVLAKDQTYTVSFTIAPAIQWMTFAGNVSTIGLDIKQGTSTYTQIDTVRSYAQSNYLDLSIEQLGIGEMFSSSFGHYSFSSVSTWQAGAPLLLPYSGVISDAQSLSIWALPNDLIDLADTTGRAVTPRFQVQTGTIDPATKAMVYKQVSNYGWGTQVTFTIKKVPESLDSPTSATTYEISGADGNNALILEQMVKYLGNNDGLIDQIIFGYAPDQSNGSNPGIQTDPLNRLIVGIAQANLSTFTRPESSVQARMLLAGTEDAAPEYTLLNASTAMVQLLWQASITRDGGYYLYYYNDERDGGLPDHIFNDKGEAALSLLTIYSKDQNPDLQDLLEPCMNIFVTGDPVNVSDSTIFAQANPVQHTASFGAGDTLNNLAYQYYTNIGDVVTDNPAAPLATDKDIYVAEGTYQVTSASGETLQSVADKFNTTPEAIKAVNPVVTNWPSVLPLYMGLRLPELTVRAAAGMSTMADIGYRYGMDLTSLAYYNGDTVGLFVPGTSLIMRGGPVTRVATVPAGVVSLEAIRTEPADIPSNPSDNGYASLFLQQNFSILTFGLVGNSWFNASNPSLPAGPTDSQPAVPGKWIFRQSVPYYKFANQQSIPNASGLPGIETSPYKGIGYLVQADFEWCDIYGNTILTTLAQPPANADSIVNEAPILTGYTDALLAVNQWPSVSVAWQVTGGSQPRIQLPLSFDTTQYNGLLSVTATSSTALLLTFTTALDEATAVTLTNYSISPSATVSAAVLQSSTTVLLTVSELAEVTQYTVAIGNIRDSARLVTYNGQATFSYPDVPAEATSSIVQQAASDFQVYTQLWYQLTDPAGIEMSMQTSLFGHSFTVDAATYKDLLENWITPIYLYLQDRSMGNTAVAAPPQLFTFTFDIDPAQVVKDQIFEVLLSFTIARTGGAVMGDFETTGGVKKVTTNISPSTASDTGNTMALDDFAESFEAAMSVDGAYYLKIATGADRNKLGQQSPDGTIWAVRLGTDEAGPISYSIDNAGTPALFAPMPVSNKLESRSGVDIYTYTTGTGIDFNNPSYQSDFTEVDLDQWVGSFFSAIDQLLTPEFTASIQLVDKKLAVSYLEHLQDAKESLADIAKLLMVPVFADEVADPAAVQEALKQALLVKLTNLYATNSGIQFDATVHADAPDGTPPNLYGSFLQNTILDGAVTEPDALRIVTLYFSAPLDAASAQDISNYTLTAPLTVLSATLSSDSKSVVLTASADITIDMTTATVSNKVLDANMRPVAGNLTDTIATDFVSYSKPDQLTITSAKIALDSTAGQPLALLLTTPEIVRGVDGEVLSQVTLNLSYKSSDIEHQIATPVNGFTPSSWLSFVLPSTRVEPLEKQLGGFSVPMFLRSFPQNPSLVNQSGVAPNTGNPDISKLLEWNYTFNYSQTFHYPQDTLNFTVNFNVGDALMAAFRAIPDAFNQLAEFIVVYPSIEADLKTLVTRIDATVYNDDSAEAAKLFNDASVALSSFVQVVEHVVTAADSGGGLMMNARTAALTSTGAAEPYLFNIQEGPRNLDGVSVQVVTVYGAPPDGIGTPQVLIEPETYKMIPWTNEQDPCKGYVCYYYESIADGKPLTSSVAQNIQGRQVVLPQLNVLQRQDALTTVHLTRNQNLIEGKVTSDVFVYTTGDLSFSNAYLPTITSDQRIEIANLPANQGVPTTRTLYEQLKTLMDTLLAENTEPELSFQMVCSYDYAVNPSLSPINLPVIMQTIVPVTLATGLDPMLQNWATAMNNWVLTNTPNKLNAAFRFNLVIFSNLTQQPYPLVVLNNLALSLTYIAPEA